MKKRKCERCGANLSDEDMMKLRFDDGSMEIIPLPLCPECFKKQMMENAIA